MDTKAANKLMIPLTDSKLLLPSAAGGKASALSELIKFGFEVPKGFVITTSAVNKLIGAQTGNYTLFERLANKREQNTTEVAKILQDIRTFLTQMTCPDWFSRTLSKNLNLLRAESYAVRSSAVAEDGIKQSWAGMFDSYLNVSTDDVFHHVCKCCASYYSDRSIAYRDTKLPSLSNIQFAVIIQEMVPAQASCVVFSEDPSDSAKVRIEAAKGLGSELVGGQITPDTYLLDRLTGILVERNKHSIEQSSDIGVNLLSQIYEIAMGTEAAFGFPVDVELAIAGNQVSVLQARKITSLVMRSSVDPDAVPIVANYELTFKVQGLEFLFSDMLAKGFGYLDPLFVSIDGEFCQYFPREKMHWAALEGYRWLSEDNGFDQYENSYRQFNKQIRNRLSTLCNQLIDSNSLIELFDVFAEIMTRYSRMDFQFTNLVWHYAESDETIAKNLTKLSNFKDDARTWLNEILLEENGYYARIVDILSRTLQRESVEIVNMSIDEICSELEEAQSVPNSLIETRQNSFAIYSIKGSVKYIGDINEIKERYSRKSIRSDDALKLFGQVANGTQDTIKGIARIINVDYANPAKMQREMDEMQKGEILISEFTAPELMPACKKALAIVTDLGGMLSHAAIVSRELGIPCMVGTEQAASVFRTGDFVTVDFAATSVFRTQ